MHWSCRTGCIALESLLESWGGVKVCVCFPNNRCLVASAGENFILPMFSVYLRRNQHFSLDCVCHPAKFLSLFVELQSSQIIITAVCVTLQGFKNLDMLAAATQLDKVSSPMMQVGLREQHVYEEGTSNKGPLFAARSLGLQETNYKGNTTNSRGGANKEHR